MMSLLQVECFQEHLRASQKLQMRNTRKLLKMANVALISVHPEYVNKIVSGEKLWEFRRTWAKSPVDFLVVYSTSPVKRIMAIIEIGEEIRGSKQKLWELSRDRQGGISRRKLFSYLNGKEEGVALQLKSKFVFKKGIDPNDVFGAGFRAPQSFQYMSQKEWSLIRDEAVRMSWE